MLRNIWLVDREKWQNDFLEPSSHEEEIGNDAKAITKEMCSDEKFIK